MLWLDCIIYLVHFLRSFCSIPFFAISLYGSHADTLFIIHFWSLLCPTHLMTGSEEERPREWIEPRDYWIPLHCLWTLPLRVSSMSLALLWANRKLLGQKRCLICHRSFMRPLGIYFFGKVRFSTDCYLLFWQLSFAKRECLLLSLFSYTFHATQQCQERAVECSTNFPPHLEPVDLQNGFLISI